MKRILVLCTLACMFLRCAVFDAQAVVALPKTATPDPQVIATRIKAEADRKAMSQAWDRSLEGRWFHFKMAVKDWWSFIDRSLQVNPWTTITCVAIASFLTAILLWNGFRAVYAVGMWLWFAVHVYVYRHTRHSHA